MVAALYDSVRMMHTDAWLCCFLICFASSSFPIHGFVSAALQLAVWLLKDRPCSLTVHWHAPGSVVWLSIRNPQVLPLNAHAVPLSVWV